MKLVGLIFILYFDEDHGSFRIVVGLKNKNIGSLYFYYGWIYISGLTTVQLLCCWISEKKKGVKKKIYPRFSNAVLVVLTA